MYLALRELQYHKLRSALVGGIVALIAFMVFMLMGLTRGLSRDSASLILETPAERFVTTKDAEGVFTRSFLTPEQVKDLQAQSAGATAFAQTFVSFGNGDRQLSGVLLGVDPAGFLAPSSSEGARLGTAGAVVDESLKEDGVKLGDTITLKPSGETLKVVGFSRSARLNHQAGIFVSLDEWHKLNSRTRGTVNAVALKTQSPEVQGDYSVLSRAQTLQVLPGYREEQGSLTMIQVFLVAVAAFVMAAFFYVMTLQKTAQFGLLKAIGAGTRKLAGSLLAQMLLLTLLAVAFAAAMTLGMVQLLPSGMPFHLTPQNIAAASGLLVLVAALASLLSLRSIARVDPLIAIGTTA